MVKVLEEDEALGRRIPESSRRAASAAAIAPVAALPYGAHAGFTSELDAEFGLLVLEGFAARHVSFGTIASSEVIGPGDLLSPRVSAPPTPDGIRIEWEVLQAVRLAILDEDFAQRTRPWPAIAAALLERAMERANAQALQAALHQARRVEDRVLLALWYFAGRWGETTEDGRVLPGPRLRGELLASFVGARRQSVSTAFGVLRDRGVVRRLPDGRFLLPSEPPELAAEESRPDTFLA